MFKQSPTIQTVIAIVLHTTLVGAQTMSTSTKKTIDALVNQGLSKAQVIEVLTLEYYVDALVLRYLSTI